MFSLHPIRHFIEVVTPRIDKLIDADNQQEA